MIDLKLLNQIKEQVVLEQHEGEELYNPIDLFNNEDWPEVCFRYAEAVNKKLKREIEILSLGKLL